MKGKSELIKRAPEQVPPNSLGKGEIHEETHQTDYIPSQEAREEENVGKPHQIDRFPLAPKPEKADATESVYSGNGTP